MNRDEALKQIEEINFALEAGNRLLLSGMMSIFLGITILILPLIEIPSQQLTFGHDLGGLRPYILPVIHVVVYLTLFSAVKVFVEKTWVDAGIRSPHPALAQALAIHRPVVAAICGSMLMLGYLGLEQLVYPFFMIMFGTLMNFYGRFANRKLFWAGWSYIVVGVIFGALTKTASSNVWVIFNSYLGLSLIYVGFSIKRERNRN